jgi:serine/threonine protein kinase
VSQEGVHAVKDACDFDEVYQKREERLESLLGAARASAEAYNTTYKNANAGSFIFHLRNVKRMAECGVMGARAAPVPMTTTEVAIVTKRSVLGAAKGLWELRAARAGSHEEAIIPCVLSMFDDWAETHLNNVHAERSDAAVKALLATFGDAASVGVVLGFADGETCEGRGRREDGLEETLEIAGSAILEEYEHQCKGLSFFPYTALLHAGRQLLEVWKTESAAIRHTVEVYGMLKEDLEQHATCVDSAGLLAQQKDAAVAELHAARVSHDYKIVALKAMMLVIEMRNENTELIKYFAQGFRLQSVSSDHLMDRLHSDVRESSANLTAAIMKLTGDIQHHFPEVILLVGQGVPAELGLLWRPSQSLRSSEERELLRKASETRHRVWPLRDGEDLVAIKEYPIRQASDLHTCFKEATIIYRHRHLNIVEINAIFLGTGYTSNTFYMQMPWYKHGSVDKWVCSDQQPKWTTVRNVLLDALVGLAHLHENGIVHCDVKPSNILVDDRERGRLSGFDISIDTKEHTSARGMIATTMRGTEIGMTNDFAAPELQSSGQATKRTDMFAYGKTVLFVQVYCEPAVQDAGSGLHLKPGTVDNARGQTEELVRNMTSENPSGRPSAKDVIERSPFFVILKDVCLKVRSVCLLCESMGDDCKKDTDAGIECSEGHFHCGSCVSILVQDLLKVEHKGKLARLMGEVKCFKCPTECNAPGFTERDLARHLSLDDFQAYLKARLEILEANLKIKVEEESRKLLEEEISRLRSLDERERRVLLARKHIEEEIIQPKCPRQSCRRAFHDFEGCFAISCSSCTCKFCGWCLQDCGDRDAHPHVRQCTKVPRGVDALFPMMPTVREAFEKTHKERCRERIKHYIDNEVQQDIREQVKQQVLKIDPCL